MRGHQRAILETGKCQVSGPNAGSKWHVALLFWAGDTVWGQGIRCGRASVTLSAQDNQALWRQLILPGSLLGELLSPPPVGCPMGSASRT